MNCLSQFEIQLFCSPQQNLSIASYHQKLFGDVIIMMHYGELLYSE